MPRRDRRRTHLTKPHRLACDQAIRFLATVKLVVPKPKNAKEHRIRQVAEQNGLRKIRRYHDSIGIPRRRFGLVAGE